MSPSEDDLKAALHEGDSLSLDVDQLILHARARVAQRRVHLLSGAAITIVVAAVGVGGAFLAINTGGNESSSSNSGDMAAGGGAVYGPDHGSALSGARHPAGNAPVNGAHSEADSAAGVACPKTPPHYLLPGGGSPGQFGAGGPLFDKPVAYAVVCSYGTVPQPVTQAGRQPARLLLRDGAAQRLVASLENAPKIPPEGLCPDYRLAAEQQLAIFGIAANGQRAGTVTTTIGRPPCEVQVTNGTAVRYAWTPPPDLAKQLLALAPTAAPKSTAVASPTN